MMLECLMAMLVSANIVGALRAKNRVLCAIHWLAVGLALGQLITTYLFISV